MAAVGQVTVPLTDCPVGVHAAPPQHPFHQTASPHVLGQQTSAIEGAICMRACAAGRGCSS